MADEKQKEVAPCSPTPNILAAEIYEFCVEKHPNYCPSCLVVALMKLIGATIETVAEKNAEELVERINEIKKRRAAQAKNN